MAPMDKYTRLVGGAVHGLSCFHSDCSGLPMFFSPFIKPWNKGSDIKKDMPFRWCYQDTSSVIKSRKKRRDVIVVSCNGSMFWYQSDKSLVLIQQGGVCKEWIRQSTVWCITDLTSPALQKSRWGGKDGETISVIIQLAPFSLSAALF